MWSIGDIISGQIESNPLVGDVVDVGEFLLIFENGTSDRLQELYFAEQAREFAVCLKGDVVDGDYIIDDLYVPEMYEQRFNHVRFEGCDGDSLVLLHTHPYKSCLASDTDLETLQRMREINEDVLMVVMCEPGRFSVY